MNYSKRKSRVSALLRNAVFGAMAAGIRPINNSWFARSGKIAHIAPVDLVASRFDPRNSRRMSAVSLEKSAPAVEGPRGPLMQKETAMAVGTVKFFNTTKGFGFIAQDGGGKDVFVHISAVERSGMSGLADGQKVSFDLEKDRQGRDSAINLKAV
jgi:CspA family cold shock protein